MGSKEETDVHSKKGTEEIGLQGVNPETNSVEDSTVVSMVQEFIQSANSYQSIYDANQEIVEIANSILDNRLVSKQQFDDPNYKANYGTDEQVARDRHVTTLLAKYVSNYSNKIEINGEYKERIFTMCECIIVMYAIIVPVIIVFACSSRRGVSITGADVVALISVCVSFLGLIIGLMQIITKYVFPEKEEEYITQIVRAIQENDLKHKKQNMKFLSKMGSKVDNAEDKNTVSNIGGNDST